MISLLLAFQVCLGSFSVCLAPLCLLNVFFSEFVGSLCLVFVQLVGSGLFGISPHKLLNFIIIFLQEKFYILI